MSRTEGASRVRHDLGRYVALQTRFVGVDGPVSELRDALEADLLHTHRSPGGDRDVSAVWAALRVDLIGVDVAHLDGLVAELGRRSWLLGELDEAELRHTASLALACAAATRNLSDELRTEG